MHSSALMCVRVCMRTHTHKINLLNYKQIKTFERFIEKSASEIVTAKSPGCCGMDSLNPCLIFSGEAVSLPSFIMFLDLLMHLLVRFSYPGKGKGGSRRGDVGIQGHPGYF